MPVKLKKETVTHWISGKSLQWQLKKKKQTYVFKNGYHFNDLFTIKHNYASINKMKLRTKKKKIHDILNSLWVVCLTAEFPSEQV